MMEVPWSKSRGIIFIFPQVQDGVGRNSVIMDCGVIMVVQQIKQTTALVCARVDVSMHFSPQLLNATEHTLIVLFCFS